MLAAYLEAKYCINDKLTFDAGLRSQLLTLNNAISFEPRLGLKYQVNAKNSVAVGFGHHSQMQPLSVYYYRYQLPDFSYDESNRDLGFTNSLHFAGSYEVLPFVDWRVKAEIYYQLLCNVPISKLPNSFSTGTWSLQQRLKKRI